MLFPDFLDFWSYFLNIRFLIAFGLVGAFFLPLLLSLAVTWFSEDEEPTQQRAERG